MWPASSAWQIVCGLQGGSRKPHPDISRAECRRDLSEDIKMGVSASPDFETHFHISLLVVNIIIPIILFLLKHFVFNHVPTKDLLFLISAVTT